MKYSTDIYISVEHPAGATVSQEARDATIAELMKHCRKEVVKLVDRACAHVVTAVEPVVDNSLPPIRVEPYCRDLCGNCYYWHDEPMLDDPICCKFNNAKLREVWNEGKFWLRCDACLKATDDWDDKTKHNNEVE